MKTFPRLLLHFIATAAAFCICFVLVGGYKATPGSVAVIVLLYLLVYAVAAAFVALIRYIVKADDNTKKDGKKSDGRKTDGKKKTESKSDEYTSIFNGKK